MTEPTRWKEREARSPNGLQPAAAPDLAARRLDGLLDQQHALFVALDEQSRRQRTFIEQGDTDGLLSVLAQRQKLIEQIVALGKELEPFRRDWDRIAPQLAADRRLRLAQRINSLDELVRSILDRDDSDRRNLELKRDSVGTELTSLSRARGAVAAYTATGAAAPRYQDREG